MSLKKSAYWNGKIHQVLTCRKPKLKKKNPDKTQTKKILSPNVWRKRRGLQIKILFRGVANQNVKNCE